MVESIVKFATAVLEAKVSAWRTFVVGAVFGGALHIAYACGWIPGVVGFAKADEVANNTLKLTAIEKTLDCNAIDSEINRLRGELRGHQARLFEAEQMQNQDLVAYLRGVIAAVQDEVDDEIRARTVNSCALAD